MSFNEELLGLFEEEMGEMAQLTTLSGDLRNKIIAVYGDNGTGKTTQISRLGKLGYNVVFISLEKGLNAVSGVMNIGVKEYADVKKAVEKLTATKKGKPNKFLEMLEKEPIIIVWDGIENLKTLAEKYVCGIAGVNKVGEGNKGYGLWAEYNTALKNILIPVFNEGYTNILISHPEPVTKKVGKETVTVGLDYGCEKRLKKIIKDNADFILYVENNEPDDDGNEVLSTAISRPVDGIIARTRFRYFPTEFEFTAENLMDNLKMAVEKQAEEEGVELVSAKKQQSVYGNKEDKTLEDLLDDVKDLLNNLEEGSKKEDKAFELLEDTFGGLGLGELTDKHIPALKVFINDLEDIINN